MNILVTGARAPIAADLARTFALEGHRVWVTDSLRAPLAAASRHVCGLIQLPPPRTEFPAFVKRLRTACRDHAIDAIVPTSEEVLWIARAAPSLPKTVDVRTSPLPVLTALHHKGTFAALATRLGYGAPQNLELRQPADLASFPNPEDFVFKPVYSRFAAHTLIGPSRPALARLRPSPDQPWLAQTLVRGRELCAYNVAAHGRLLLHVAYEPLFRLGVGASSYFSPVENQRLRTMCERFVAATDFTGQISFDAIETANGLVAIECNPRGTSGVHLAAQNPATLEAALLGRNPTTKSPATQPIQPRMLLFPLLFTHPRALFQSRARALLNSAKDALRAAEISPLAQAVAFAELAWHAARQRLTLSEAATADFEWNGEPSHA